MLDYPMVNSTGAFLVKKNTFDRLSEENRKMLWVPPCFAHGFLVTSDSADLCYKCTDFYAPEYDRSIRWDDPELAIEWPLPEGVQPVLSEKDAGAPLFRDAEKFE